MATARIYHVRVQPSADATPVERLVRASTKAQAIGHVARQTIVCEVAQVDTVYRLATEKVTIEEATNEPAAAPGEPE